MSEAPASPDQGSRALDLICMGRAAVDLYADEIGIPLEQVSRFARYLGGCPGNVAVGAARLGLRVGMLTRVGDEAMGRFVRRALSEEGVDTRRIVPDPKHLTGLVLLGIQPPDKFPLIFYRENCADIHLAPEDVDPGYIGSAEALMVSGTGLSREPSRAATFKAVESAVAAGTRVVLDLDYRPTLWSSPTEYRAVLAGVLKDCALVVGTEKEHAAAGGTPTLRRSTPGLLVLKRGARGAALLEPDGRAIDSPAFPVQVLNVLGAGDGFLAGFLSAWLSGGSSEESLKRACAVGAVVVTRHGCAPAMPTRAELEAFLAERA